MPLAISGTSASKSLVRNLGCERGSRAKIAVHSSDEHVDPVGAIVGQRGVRVAVVTSELGGEKIDVVEWSENAADFVKESLKPAQILSIELHENENRAVAQVADDQQSLAVARYRPRCRLAARLTGWKIDIRSMGGEEEAADESESAFEVTQKELGAAEEVTEATEENLEPVAQDRDIASEAVEEQQEELVDKEVDAA
jgi:N utilization substance protein A